MSTANDDSSKRLVASFVQFLKDELNKDGISPDKAESIDVARQCLHMAYATTSEDVPQKQKRLIDMFLESCPAPAKPIPLTKDQIDEAENFKQQGNNFMKEEKFDDAIQCYNKAIAIDSENAVFYCNRAAAHTGKQKYDLAITDCKKSLEIDPKYSKAFSRMGLTYSKTEMYDEAIVMYKKALELDPENDGYKKNLKIAEEKLIEQQRASAGPSIPGLGGLGGMEQILNSPMVQQMMQNPAMQQMAMNMMTGLMGGGGGGGGGGSSSGGSQGPDMSQVMQMGQQFAQQLQENNPELVEQLRNQMTTTDKTDGEGQNESPGEGQS